MTLGSASIDNDRIRAYLDGTLPDAERDAFELRVLVEPALQDEIDLELALREGLRAHGADAVAASAATAVAAPVVTAMPTPIATQASARASRRARPRWLALAASFVAGAVLPTAWLLDAQRGTPTDGGFAPLGNVPALLVDPVRSANVDVVVAVDAASPLLLLQVPVYPQHADERYSLRIEREDGSAVAELQQLKPDGQDRITALLPSASLPPGRYRLDLRSLHAGVVGEQRRIPLRIGTTG